MRILPMMDQVSTLPLYFDQCAIRFSIARYTTRYATNRLPQASPLCLRVRRLP